MAELSPLDSYKEEYVYAFEDNWDGEGAKKLEPNIINKANEILSKYGSEGYLVEVSPGKDGSLSLTWDDKEGNYVYLDIGPSKTMHLYYDVKGLPKWEVVTLETNEEFLKKLFESLKFTHIKESNNNPVVPNGNNNQ